jgi:hypothetical protein
MNTKSKIFSVFDIKMYLFLFVAGNVVKSTKIHYSGAREKVLKEIFSRRGKMMDLNFSPKFASFLYIFHIILYNLRLNRCQSVCSLQIIRDSFRCSGGYTVGEEEQKKSH